MQVPLDRAPLDYAASDIPGETNSRFAAGTSTPASGGTALGERVDESDTLGVEAGDITYAALLERHAAKEPITDEMIHQAHQRVEIAGRRPGAHPSDESALSRGGSVIIRLLRVFR